LCAFVLAALLLPACGGGGGSFTPPALALDLAVARVGQEIRIVGPGFGAVQGLSTAMVGGAAAAVTSWTQYEVRVLVPAGALSGVVQLMVGGIPINPGSITILWPQFNPQNVAVSTATSDQELPEAVTDGAGGSIVVWRDLRNGNFDVFAQRMSTAGAPLWTVNGVAVCTQLGDQDYPQIVSDGAGGAIIVWQDSRSGTADIYAQRLNALGAPQWTADGIGVCTVAGVQELPRIGSDGAGGAIIAWRDLRSGLNIDLMAQRLNSAGTALWTAGGVVVSTAGGGPATPRIVASAGGGGILVWDDIRTGDFNIFAQRLEGVAGAAQWTANGATICSAVSTQTRACVAPDGAGGAVMAWSDYRNGNSDIFAQRVDSAGAPQWTADGVVVCSAVNNQDFSQLVPDGAGGAFLVWEDARNGVSNKDIFAQRINGSGVSQWTPDGIAVCLAAANQSLAQIISDGAGGVVIAWEDLRNGLYDVFAQRLNGAGAIQWALDGAALCTVAGSPQQDVRIVPDGTGGAVAAWRDARSGVDVFAQKLIGSGQQ
jgi:hypothetical protein